MPASLFITAAPTFVSLVLIGPKRYSKKPEKEVIVSRRVPHLKTKGVEYLLFILLALAAIACMVDIEEDNAALKNHVKTLQETCSGL